MKTMYEWSWKSVNSNNTTQDNNNDGKGNNENKKNNTSHDNKYNNWLIIINCFLILFIIIRYCSQ